MPKTEKQLLREYKKRLVDVETITEALILLNRYRRKWENLKAEISA